MMQAMREKIREQELLSDVLKSELCVRAGWDDEEVNAFVIKKTCGGPKRFRPMIREELANRLAETERQLKRAQERLRQQQQQQHIPHPQQYTSRRRSGVGGGEGKDASEDEDAASLAAEIEELAKASSEGRGRAWRPPATVTRGSVGPQASTASVRETRALGQLSELAEEVEELRVAVKSRDLAMHAQAQELDTLRADSRALRAAQDALSLRERRVAELKRRHKSLSDQHAEVMAEHEASQEEVQHLRAQLDLQSREGSALVESLNARLLKQAEDVADLLAREQELTAELDRQRHLGSQERMDKHHEAREAEAKAAASAEAKRAAERRAARAEEKADQANAEVQRLTKALAESATFKERVRALNVDKSSLTKQLADSRARLEAATEELAAVKALGGAAEKRGEPRATVPAAAELEAALQAERKAKQELEALLKASEARVAALHKDAEAMPTRQAEGDGAAVKELQGQLSSRDREIAKLREEVREAHHDAEIMVGELDEALLEIGKLKAAAAEAASAQTKGASEGDAAAATDDDRHGGGGPAAAELVAVESKLAQAEARAAAAEREKRALAAKLAEAQAERDAARARLSALRQEWASQVESSREDEAGLGDEGLKAAAKLAVEDLAYWEEQFDEKEVSMQKKSNALERSSERWQSRAHELYVFARALAKRWADATGETVPELPPGEDPATVAPSEPATARSVGAASSLDLDMDISDEDED